MAHTFETNNGVTFIFNGDFSGPVAIHAPNGEQISVEFDDLKEFVSGWVRSEKIREFENMSADELLKGFE